MKSSSATCKSDPLPTPLLKLCIDDIIEPLTKIVNLLLQNSDLPTSMKNTIITPILKKANLDPNVLKNYRPISNLTFVSKIIEKSSGKKT